MIYMCVQYITLSDIYVKCIIYVKIYMCLFNYA